MNHRIRQRKIKNDHYGKMVFVQITLEWSKHPLSTKNRIKALEENKREKPVTAFLSILPPCTENDDYFSVAQVSFMVWPLLTFSISSFTSPLILLCDSSPRQSIHMPNSNFTEVQYTANSPLII